MATAKAPKAPKGQKAKAEAPLGSTATIKTRVVPVAELLPAGYNPRKITAHALAGLKASIQEFGYAQPIVWNERTSTVVGGHQRLTALVEMGVTAVEVVVVDMDPLKERAANMTFNNPANQGTWNDEKLQALIEELQGSIDDGSLDAGYFESIQLDELAATFDFYEVDTGKDKPPRDTGAGDDEPPPEDGESTRVHTVSVFVSSDQLKEWDKAVAKIRKRGHHGDPSAAIVATMLRVAKDNL